MLQATGERECTYHNFVIEFQAGNQGSYPVQVESSPCQSHARGHFIPPFSASDMEAVLEANGLSINVPSSTGQTPVQDQIKDLRSREIGRLLFQRLFSENNEILSCLRTSQASIGSGDVLRLVLRFDKTDSGLSGIAELPWELMLDPQNNDFMALQQGFSLARYAETGKKGPLVGKPQRIKTLAVLPEPSDFPEFDRQQFAAIIREASSQNSSLELHFLREGVTVENLRRKLGEIDPHILYFVGHGGRAKNTWGLAFETGEGNADIIAGQNLATILSASKSLSLICLISCDTNRQDPAIFPFNGISAALVKRGFAHVIATQFPIPVAVAKTLTQSIFNSLGNQETLDRIVAEARLVLFSEDMRSFNWVIPVFFTNNQQHELFGPEAIQKVKVNTRQRDLRQKDEPKGVELVDFAQLFQGSTTSNHHVRYPGVWQEVIWPKLQGLQNQLDPRQKLCFSGEAWTSVWLALGKVFGSNSEYFCLINQKNNAKGRWENWQYTGQVPPPVALEVEQDLHREDSTELVVCLEANVKIFNEVKAYFSAASPQGPKLWLTLRPPQMQETFSIPDSQTGIALAYAMARKTREVMKAHQIKTIHLFVAAPKAVSFFFTHFFTNSRRLQLYEYTNPGYQPSILVEN